VPEFDLSQQDDVPFMPGLACLSPEGTQTCVARLGGTRGFRRRYQTFSRRSGWRGGGPGCHPISPVASLGAMRGDRL